MQPYDWHAEGDFLPYNKRVSEISKCNDDPANDNDRLAHFDRLIDELFPDALLASRKVQDWWIDATERAARQQAEPHDAETDLVLDYYVTQDMWLEGFHLRCTRLARND